ncbi:MAG: hypothetical protein PV353_03260, partial [Bartonella sp.]|nr:hypothetical protein [Bartonella sp.]
RRGISVDIDAFEKAMELQKAENHANWFGSGELITETIWFSIRDQVGTTEFLGYEKEKAEGVITALVCDGEIVNHISSGQDA